MNDKLLQAIPAYQQVKNYVTSRIQDGTWKQGELVPSEHELVKQFSVSRMTVTRALRELTAEQLLVRVQGAGTFVAEQKYGSTAVSIRNIAEEVTARGHAYSCQVLALEAVDDEAARAMLDMDAGEVFHSRIVHFENGLPIQYEDRYVSPRVFPKYLEQDFTKETPNKYLVRVAPVKRASYRIEAKTPDAQVRKRLLMEIGEPCLVLFRRTWVLDDVATAVTLWHPGSRYQFTGEF
jgi:GntR family transcriptional regulator, histidine utilization repressor